MNVDDVLRHNSRTAMGALMLIGIGAFLLVHNMLPEEAHAGSFHAALLLGAIALACGAIDAFGDGRRAWARVPAAFFGALAAVAFFAAGPLHWLAFGFGLPLWPVLLIGVGFWLVRRDRLARTP